MSTEPLPYRDFTEIPVGALDVLDESVLGHGRVPRPNAEGQLSLLVTARGRPLGTVLLHGLAVGTDYDQLRDACLRELGDALSAQLRSAGVDTAASPAEILRALELVRPHRATATTTPVSVIVCTLGRDPRLRETVQSLLQQTHEHLELCVVDNDPGSGGTRALLDGVTDARLRVVDEPRRGLSVARNTGLAVAAHPLVAFTDDDALPDSNWLRELVAVFEADPEQRVTAVTGLVRAAELSSPEQLWFESYGGFDKGYERRVWSWGAPPASVRHLGTPPPHGPFFPYTSGKVGSGNNMAFRTERLRELGGFDVALGAGTVAKGGEDLDTFSEVLLAGDVIVYTPDAVVWHHHRRTYPELRTQMAGHGIGMGAVITKQLLRGPRHAAALVRRAPSALALLVDPRSSRNAGRGPDYPRDLILTEMRGLLAGPYHLLRSRHEARRLAPPSAAPSSS